MLILELHLKIVPHLRNALHEHVDNANNLDITMPM